MTKEAMARKKLWRCNVCNDIHYGIKGPDVCPTCGARNAFALIDYPEAMKVIIDRGKGWIAWTSSSTFGRSSPKASRSG